MKPSFIMRDDGIMLSIGMTPYNIDRSHPRYEQILEAVKDENWDAIPALFSITRALEAFGNGNITVDSENGVVLYLDEEVHNTLTDRMLRMMSEGFSVKPLAAFLDNLMENPSKRSVDELYGFLEYGKMPITEDGHFLAYKRVNGDYTSVHDSKTKNNVGSIVEMPRNKVDDDKDRTCSNGLHFCSHEYLSSFSGQRVVVLKINPADVVSIPSDYHNTKGRACRYEVVGELTGADLEKALGGTMFSESVNTDFDAFGDEDDADRDIVEDEAVRAEEQVSQSYKSGYDRGYKDGRAGTALTSNVIVTEFVAATDEYVEGYTRGHKDGKGHKAKALFTVAPMGPFMRSDEYVAGYKDGHAEYNGDSFMPYEGAACEYEQGYAAGWEEAEEGIDAQY